ncbi:MAG TPA: AfsR/SARP family transcriptional regulator [Asanoa sp.]|jgi:DNA-binding SARP family transcriptional activator|nr:AfsR/SARP family transcriptional regulator [Asanoa sp.]
MIFYLLGPVRAEVDGNDVILGGEKQRTVLASLLVNENRSLSNDRLAQLLWDTKPPNTANAQIHTYMSRLRGKLSPYASILRQHHGYLLRTGDCRIDYKEFNCLVRRAQDALADGHFSTAARGFRASLELWKGTALTDVTTYLHDKIGPAWEETRMAALEGRIRAELQLGLHARLVPELTELVQEYPYREELRAHLMTALYLSGRQADALSVYEEGRRILVEEVGVDPGEVLVRTHLAVLRGYDRRL